MSPQQVISHIYSSLLNKFIGFQRTFEQIQFPSVIKS